MNTICGIFRRTGGPVSDLDAVLAALPGRATDVTAVSVDGSAGLGCRGEAVATEGRAASAPLVDRDAGLVAIAAARVDDRESLCDCLDVPGPERARLPDVALILRAYRRWGTECPDHLLGAYAFAIWDMRRRTLFCARDHIGARSFYYSLTAEHLVFASSVRAVLAAPDVSENLDEEAVATLLTHRARSFGARTFYRDVRRLPPGHLLLVKTDAARLERWWRPENVPAAPPGDGDSLAEGLLETCGRAVADRVRGPYPVGVHLSGGLDSSSVAVLTARALQSGGRPAPSAFSWQPMPRGGASNAPETDEHGLIEAVARQEGLPLFYCPPGIDDLVAYLRADATLDPDIHPNEEPARRHAAALGVRVILSGWGGDEGISFNGRGFHAELLLSGRIGRLWREIGESSGHPFASIVSSVALPLASPPAARAVRALRLGTWPQRNRSLIHPAFARRVRPLPATPLPRVGVRRLQLHLLQTGHLAARIEGWAAGGARHGIEYRYPLLDRRVLEFALGLPPEQFRRGRWSRWLLRRALAPLLPPQVCWNLSKHDPSRHRALSAALAGALPVVRTVLEDRSALQLRSRYLDMPRLMQALRAHQTPPTRPGGPGPLYNALRLLDY